MTVKDVVQQIELIYGRQPLPYMLRLINDALLDMGSKSQHYTVVAKTDLVGHDRWYALDDQVIDIYRVEILDSNSRYTMIPKLTDPHRLLKGDTDISADSLT